MATPEKPTPPQFFEQIKYLSSLDYRDRRQELWRCVVPRLPRFLYKFRSLVPSDTTSVDRLRDVIVRSRLWLSSPVSFNDPYDTSAQILLGGDANEIRRTFNGFLKQRGLKFSKRKKELTRMMSYGLEGLQSHLQQTFERMASAAGVCSFGGNPRSILMWTHYAANHEGVCLQFELARDVATFAQALPVEYNEDYPTVNWVEINNIDDSADLVLTTLLRKFTGWAYEEEHRIIRPEAAGESLRFRPDALTAIIIGARAPTTTIKRLNELLAERSATPLPMLKLYQASKHVSKYRLILKRV